MPAAISDRLLAPKSSVGGRAVDTPLLNVRPFQRSQRGDTLLSDNSEFSWWGEIQERLEFPIPFDHRERKG